jgi:SAM-dependent methyltransferase
MESPPAFFREASRVLLPNGRIIFIEPAITPVSRVFLGLFHPEPIDLSINPCTKRETDPSRKPFDANQAVPTLLFGRYRNDFLGQFPDLKIITLKYLDIVAYPLSGGFRPWCLVPGKILRYLFELEHYIIPVLGPLMAFRYFGVLEKNAKISELRESPKFI